MDNRPIGIFDSGVGGLSSVRVLIQEAPHESFVYFGDTARVPYGDRTAEDIRDLSLQGTRFLRTHDVKALVIACNTSTANAMPILKARYSDLPVIGVVDPAVLQAIGATRTGRIGIIATNATIRSGAYEDAIEDRCPQAVVTSQSCPELVPLIEMGHTGLGDPLLMPVLERYLAPVRAARVDTLILGCTHYPLIRSAVQEIMGPAVCLVDSGAACIQVLLQTLADTDSLVAPDAEKLETYYCSARREDFVRVAEQFLGGSVEAMTEQIDIDRY